MYPPRPHRPHDPTLRRSRHQQHGGMPARPVAPRRSRYDEAPQQPQRSTSPRVALLAGGSMAFLAAIAILPAQLRPSADAQSATQCQEVIQKEARLSRDQLTQFLALPEQSAKTAVQGVIAAPYCRLPASDTAAVREAYPLAFDPDTWFVVQYSSSDLYTGYEFTFRK